MIPTPRRSPDGFDRRRLQPNSRAISAQKLQKILTVGILLFVLAIFAMYARLTNIESTNNPGWGLMRGHDIVRNNPDNTAPKLDPRLQLQRNNNHLNPGRGWGSERGRVKCDEDISRLVSYWNDPRSDVDRAFQSPFLDAPSTNVKNPKRARYLSFEPDMGGWNNIRMEFEIMVVLAAATGRTLVLPPDNPMYLLHRDPDNKHRGLQQFFQGFDHIVDVITTAEFFQKEMVEKKNYPLPTDEKNRTRVLASLQNCLWIGKSDNSCIHLFDYMTTIADLVPNWHGEHHCLIMDDENWFKDKIGNVNNAQRQQQIEKFCAKRVPIYYNQDTHDAPLLHFHSHKKNTRLLLHFYTFIYFTNPKIGNHYRRLVRDRVRYSDDIFCAGGRIVKSLIEESMGRHFNGAGAEAGYFSMHIRRGDFQWPKMRISAEEWFENTKPWLEPDEQHLLYIATDETNRTWFEPLMKHYQVRFLDDFSELAGLSKLDPNFVGMIDQVVAAGSRVFVGTYFSSFSAYIGRIRGYHGISGKKMYYSHLDRWNETHNWAYPHSSYSAREYPIGWAGIDGDEEPSEKSFY